MNPYDQALIQAMFVEGDELYYNEIIDEVIDEMI